MKKLLVLALIAALAGLASCRSQKQEEMINGLPSFVSNPPVADDALCGVGFGKQSTFEMSRTIAMTNARADIARQIETTIQATVVSYAQESGVDNTSQAITFAETVTREMTNTTLSGVVPVRLVPDKEGGVWVLLSYSRDNLRQAAETAFVRHEDAAFAEFKAAEALRRLDQQMADHPPQSQPVY
jgi:hypothetical protein